MAFLTPEELQTHLYKENIETIAREDDAIVAAAIDAAIEEASGYLGAYDRKKIFGTEGDERNALLLIFVKDIAVWHFINLCNAGTDLQLRQDRYERAVAWLKSVQRSEIKPNLPVMEDADGDGKARPRCRRVHFRVEPKTITTFLIMAQIGYKTSSRKSSGTKASKPIVVQQIVVQAPQRRVYDIGDWRSALRSADNGRPKYLYDLFEDIMIDGVLADAINKRIEAVLNAEVVFMNARGQEEPAIAAMIDTTAWETLIREIMHRLFYGRAGVELFFNSGFHVEPIKPKYIDLDNCQILLNDTGDRSVPYDQDPNLLVVGRPGDYGCCSKLHPMLSGNAVDLATMLNGSSCSECLSVSENTTRSTHRAGNCLSKPWKRPDPHLISSSPRRQTLKPKR